MSRTLFFVVFWIGCARPQPPPAPEVSAPLHPTATAGVDDPILAQLLHDSWEHTMAESPVWASMLGDDRFNRQLRDIGPTAIARRSAARFVAARRGGAGLSATGGGVACPGRARRLARIFAAGGGGL